MGMSDRKCSNCEYFERYTDDSMAGQCRRFPPQVYPEHPDRTNRRANQKFPEVHEDDWCGEFKQKDEE